MEGDVALPISQPPPCSLRSHMSGEGLGTLYTYMFGLYGIVHKGSDLIHVLYLTLAVTFALTLKQQVGHQRPVSILRNICETRFSYGLPCIFSKYYCFLILRGCV